MFSKNLEKFIISLKKITVVSFIFVSTVIFLFPQTINAQNDPVVVPTVARLGTNDIETTVVNIINAALWTLGIISLVIILYAGFLWMTSGGNQEKTGKAKKIIVSATIGLIIIFSSYAIVNFVLKNLLYGVNGNSNNNQNVNNPFGYGFGSGALGGGVIEYHYPERDATDVPRNTMIMITFKVSVATSSIVFDDFPEESLEYGICQNYKNANPGVECGIMSEDIEIKNDIDLAGGTPIDSNNVIAILSADGKNVILKPREYLGSNDRNTKTSIFLKDSMSTQTNDALFGSLDTGYIWRFEVSTFLDLTPPQVTFTIPDNEDINIGRNIITQINFSEPINIFSINNNINLFTRALLDSSDFVSHSTDDFELIISNKYRTVEVFPKMDCGGYVENSCGEQVFCMPADSSIKIVLDSGDDFFNYSSGINDAAGNFLDGDKDGVAEGTPTDDHTFIFSTNDTIKLDAPIIEKINPNNNSTSIDRNTNISASFNSTISASSLNSNNFYVYKYDEILGCNDIADNATPPFLGDKENIPFSVESEDGTIYCFPNYIVYLNTDNSVDVNLENNKCNISIKSPFLYTSSIYRPRATARLKDNYGNCFNFSFGPAPTPSDPSVKQRGQQ